MFVRIRRTCAITHVITYFSSDLLESEEFVGIKRKTISDDVWDNGQVSKASHLEHLDSSIVLR
jgi:hypothetical protein